MAVSDTPDFAPAGASKDASQNPSNPLLGRRILIVEDDPFIILALEETLVEFGLVVAGSARSIKEALRLVQNESFDLALLDVNIGNETIDPVADAIAARGLPFVFTTGCGRAGLPAAHVDRAIIEKPFYIEEILRALREEMEHGDR